MQWYKFEKDKALEIIGKVRDEGMPGLFSPSSSDVRTAKLPFYTSFLLYRLTNYTTLPAFSMDYLSDGQRFYYLDGSADPIYKANATGDLMLNEATALDYLAFFVHYAPGPEGEMLFIDSSQKRPPMGAVDYERSRGLLYRSPGLTLDFRTESNSYNVTAPIYYAGALVNATISINAAGHIDVRANSLTATGESAAGAGIRTL